MADTDKTPPNDEGEPLWDQMEVFEPEESASDENESDSDVEYNGDALLNHFVHMAEKGASAGITLYTQGLTFSGQILSRKQFFEQNMAFQGGPDKAFGPTFEALLEQLDEDSDDGIVPDYRFVHLKGRSFVPGQSGMPGNGTLLRLMREDIIGWSLGVFEEGLT